MDTHIKAHFIAHTTTYEEPTIPSKSKFEPHNEPLILHIFYVHHKDTRIIQERQNLIIFLLPSVPI